ncbi:MAG: hypothetical protein Q9217_004685 [Psora testacea]
MSICTAVSKVKLDSDPVAAAISAPPNSDWYYRGSLCYSQPLTLTTDNTTTAPLWLIVPQLLMSAPFSGFGATSGTQRSGSVNVIASSLWGPSRNVIVDLLPLEASGPEDLCCVIDGQSPWPRKAQDVKGTFSAEALGSVRRRSVAG